jgi:OOP family OmpA-OmpF porin
MGLAFLGQAGLPLVVGADDAARLRIRVPYVLKRRFRNMARKSVLLTTIVTAALAAGCTFQAQGSAKAGGEQTPPPPPPPPAAPAPVATPAPAATAAPATTSTATTDKEGQVKIPGNIVFDTDKATIKEAESAPVLEQLKKFLDEHPRVTKLRIEGHTDNVGTHAHNLELSGKRALAVKNWLVAKGEKPERLIAVGFAETRPIADNSTAEGKAQNRRTEFHIAEMDGRAYLGRPVNGPAGGQVF